MKTEVNGKLNQNMDRKRILLLEDIPTDAVLAEREITGTLPDSIFHRVESREEFLNALDEFRPDVIVADYQLPGFDGLTALRIAMEKAPLIPVIMHTGPMNEDTAVECMREGATDYVIKDYNKRLGPAVKRALDISAVRLESLSAQKSLLESEARFRTFAENASDLIYRVDLLPVRRFTFVSPSSTAICGYTPEEHYADPGLGMKLIHPDDRGVLEVMARGGSLPGEPLILRWFHKDGNLIWMEHKIVYVRDRNENIIAVEGIARDITDRKNAERDIRKALEKAEHSDKLKTAFLNNLSHEIRTPLNAITGFADMLRDPGNSPEQVNHCVDIIHQSSTRLINVVEDIINISTIETGQLEVHDSEIDINLLLAQVINKVRPGAAAKGLGIDYSLDMDGNGPVIISDTGKLDYVITHLLENAIKFSDRGSIDIRCILERENLLFSVSDNGIGIDPGKHDKIFQRFNQTELEISVQRGGMGLGLPVSKSFIESLGGRMWVESTPGKGSVFFFSIPWRPAVKIHRKLLVVEDEMSNYLLLKEIMRDSKVKILHAMNGREAIESVRKHPDIDLIIMDIKMPLMDGYEATVNIRRIRPEVPVIALTAHALPGDREKAMESGCNDYLSKPFLPEDFRVIMKRYLA
jgi:PAS domain S-box-containing protein